MKKLLLLVMITIALVGVAMFVDRAIPLLFSATMPVKDLFSWQAILVFLLGVCMTSKAIYDYLTLSWPARELKHIRLVPFSGGFVTLSLVSGVLSVGFARTPSLSPWSSLLIVVALGSLALGVASLIGTPTSYDDRIHNSVGTGITIGFCNGFMAMLSVASASWWPISIYMIALLIAGISTWYHVKHYATKKITLVV